jgi:hypothetical protein
MGVDVALLRGTLAPGLQPVQRAPPVWGAMGTGMRSVGIGLVGFMGVWSFEQLRSWKRKKGILEMEDRRHTKA